MLRWRHNGIRYALSLPYDYTPENMHYATLKADEIKLDIRKGCFDTTLEKYKPPKPVKPQPVAKPVVIEEAKPLFLNDLVAKFNHWGNNIRNIDVENSIDYLYTRRLLEKWVNVPIDPIAEKLNSEEWAITTYNRRLNYLKTFFTWLLGLGAIQQNHLADVRRKREKKKKKNPRRIPISEEEISIFLEAIKNDTHCPASPPYAERHVW